MVGGQTTFVYDRKMLQNKKKKNIYCFFILLKGSLQENPIVLLINDRKKIITA